MFFADGSAVIEKMADLMMKFSVTMQEARDAMDGVILYGDGEVIAVEPKINIKTPEEREADAAVQKSIYDEVLFDRATPLHGEIELKSIDFNERLNSIAKRD